MYINPSNRNQTLHYEGAFKGLRVLTDHGPFVTEYLDALYRVQQQALKAHRRVCAFRFDLRFPVSMEAKDDNITNTLMTRFIESLKAKIRHDRQRAKERRSYAHDTDVRYVAGSTSAHLVPGTAYRPQRRLQQHLDKQGRWEI